MRAEGIPPGGGVLHPLPPPLHTARRPRLRSKTPLDHSWEGGPEKARLQGASLGASEPVQRSVLPGSGAVVSGSHVAAARSLPCAREGRRPGRTTPGTGACGRRRRSPGPLSPSRDESVFARREQAPARRGLRTGLGPRGVWLSPPWQRPWRAAEGGGRGATDPGPGLHSIRPDPARSPKGHARWLLTEAQAPQLPRPAQHGTPWGRQPAHETPAEAQTALNFLEAGRGLRSRAGWHRRGVGCIPPNIHSFTSYANSPKPAAGGEGGCVHPKVLWSVGDPGRPLLEATTASEEGRAPARAGVGDSL